MTITLEDLKMAIDNMYDNLDAGEPHFIVTHAYVTTGEMV